MTWRANGDYYSFREDMIRFHAPSVSGVYGLYNFRHQILIGHSANIQNELHRHLEQTNFRFRRFVPTGFVFEICPPELRESRTQELIREYNPILQTRRPFAALWQSWVLPNTIAFYPKVAAAKPPASDEARKTAANSGKKQVQRLRSGREQFAILATGFGIILLVAGLLTLFARVEDESGVALQNFTPDLVEKTQVASLTVPPPFSSGAFSDEAEAFEPQSTSRREAEIKIEPTIPEIVVPPELKNRESVLPAADQRQSQILKKGDRKKGWAVQAMATTDRGIANHWLEMLKAKGYEAFVINAEIKGQTWYRVRAGNFSTPQEAEALRKTLQSKEGIRDAFIAESAKSEIPIALNQK